MYNVFSRMPAGVTVGDSGLCCCLPCLLSAINSLSFFDKFSIKHLQFAKAIEKKKPTVSKRHQNETFAINVSLIIQGN